MPSRLCPIYLRDLLGFTARHSIERYRELSQHYNDVICAVPEARLPNRYFEMYIEEVSELCCTLHLSGYSESSRTPEGYKFDTLP